MSFKGYNSYSLKIINGVGFCFLGRSLLPLWHVMESYGPTSGGHWVLMGTTLALKITWTLFRGTECELPEWIFSYTECNNLVLLILPDNNLYLSSFCLEWIWEVGAHLGIYTSTRAPLSRDYSVFHFLSELMFWIIKTKCASLPSGKKRNILT